jgi:hypothetical protein
VIFGDVHGSSFQLEVLIRQVRERFGAGATLYSVGDLIDRGPDSRAVIDACVREGVLGVLGNHELWLCSVLSGHAMDDLPYTRMMGGLATLQSYGISRGDPDRVAFAVRLMVPQAHKDWLLALPPYRFVEVAGTTYLLVHAGISAWMLHQVRERGPVPDDEMPAILCDEVTDAFFWSGPDPQEPDKVARFSSFVQVFGHTPQVEAVYVPEHYVALDTGCGTTSPHRLSAVVLHEDGRREFLSVG